MKEQVLFREVMQNGIEDILEKHEIIPVVTIHAEQEIDQIFDPKWPPKGTLKISKI